MQLTFSSHHSQAKFIGIGELSFEMDDNECSELCSGVGNMLTKSCTDKAAPNFVGFYDRGYVALLYPILSLSRKLLFS